MIYLVGWTLVYYYLALSFFLRKYVRWIAIVIIVLLSLIAAFRGAVGTDTSVYDRLVTRLESWSGIEPGFWFFMYIFYVITEDPVLSIRAFAIIFSLVLIFYIYRSDDDELFFLMSFFIPLFFYNFSMNIIRFGLAFSILLLALQEDRRQRYSRALFLAFVSIIFHYAMIFPIFYLWLVQEHNKLNVRKIFWIIVFSLVIGLVIILGESYFMIKIMAYARLKEPSLFSGISRILLGLVLLSAVSLSKIPSDQKKRIIFSSLFFMAVFWGIGIYVTPRLLDMVNLLIPIAMLRVYHRIQKPMDKAFKVALFIAGLGGAMGMYRYMLRESFWTPSPFLPYHTFFDR